MIGQGRPQADGEELLTPDRVAALLAVSVRSVRRYAEEGRLVPVRIGRNVRYRLADVERLIEMGGTPGDADTGHRTPDRAGDGHERPEADISGMSARESLEAAYRVTPTEIERAIERTGQKYVTDMAALYDRISAEVGRLYAGQLAAKDETIATQRAALVTKDQALAELRRRAEQAEAGRDRLAAAQTAQDAPGATEGSTPDNPIPEASAGFWARVGRVFGGGGG